MNFVKMQGLGNDFILVEDMKENIQLTSSQINKLCDRHFGIGADGLILVQPSKLYDIKMKFYNQDGTEAAMCGNGVRCFAKYVYSYNIVNKDDINIETIAGKISAKISNDVVQVNMGKAQFDPRYIPVNIDNIKVVDEKLYINDKEIIFSSILMGVPHTIIEVEDVSNYPVKEIGPLIEINKIFPAKTNVNFVQILNKEEVKMVTWERGVGLTMACGTGACAASSILKEKKKIKDRVLIHVPGGELTIKFNKDNIFMIGPVQEVYKGIINVEIIQEG